MELRRVAPIAFAALCLGLSGLVLRRQIVAHPAPPPEPAFRAPTYPGGAEAPVAVGGWHLAPSPVRQAALTTIQSQLGAMRAGNADGAWSYQSRRLRGNFHSAQDFQGMIVGRYPEFGHSRTAVFGPVWTDKSGQLAEVVVTVRGANGRRARGRYELLQEDGGFKVYGVGGGGVIPDAAP